MKTKGKKIETTYTIKEIAKAWKKFTSPVWLVDMHKTTQEEIVEAKLIETDDPSSVRVIETDYSKWLLYLISEEWK